MLCYFLVHSKVIQPCIYIYSFSDFFSIRVYYKIVNVVPCVIQ